MADDGGGTHVDVATDLSITGKVAQFGRGVLADVSSKLMGQFVENLERDVLADDRPRRHRAPSHRIRRRRTASAPVHCIRRGRTDRDRADRRRARSSRARPSPSTCSTSPAAPVTKRLLPIGIGLLVVFVLWRILRGRSA